MSKVLISYRGIPQSPGWATGDLVVDAFKRNGHEVYTYGHYYRRGVKALLPHGLTIDQVRRDQFDLALYMEMNDGDSQYTELKYINARIRAYWDFDVSYHPQFTASVCKYLNFDHIFYANPDYRRFFSNLAPRISLLPYGFCSLKHVPNILKSIKERKYKFAIIGSPWKERKDIIKALNNEGIDAHLITDMYREDYIQALNDTQVSINYNVDKGRGLLVMRIWESLATHCCLITNSEDYIEQFFSPDEVLTYESTASLIEICKELRNNPDTVERIARQGYIAGQRYHTYDARINTILKTLHIGDNHE
jgi:spore maturation protein CgeB